MKKILTLFVLLFSFKTMAVTAEFDVKFVDLDDSRVAHRSSEIGTALAGKKLADKKLIVYANGMFSSLEAITKNFEGLRNALKAKNPPLNTEYRIAYNYNEARMKQVGQVLTQYFGEEGVQTWSEKWEKAANSYFHPIKFGTKKTGKIMNMLVKQDNYLDDNDLNIHIKNLYLPKINTQYKVVIVAHSQGNFYANLAWEAIRDMEQGIDRSKAIGIVGVAVPATYMADGRGRYITNSKDVPMNMIRTFSPKEYENLPSNRTYPFTFADKSGHGLTETYLANESFKIDLNKFVSKTFSELIRFESEDKQACGEPLSRSGGKEGLKNLAYYLGEENGKVMVSFEAYHVPDTLTIRNESGRVLTTTGVSVKGFHRKTIDYDYERDGTLIVNVTGGGENTKWKLLVGCPAQNIFLGQTAYDFVFSNNKVWSCEFDLEIDGKYQDHVRAGYGLGSHRVSDVYLTPGKHEIYYKNKVCTSNSLCNHIDCPLDFEAKAWDGYKSKTLPNPINTRGSVVMQF